MNRSILVVGSVALDSVRTPYGETKDALGGAAVFFSLAARFFSPVKLVGVVGKDFPGGFVDLLDARGIDTSGLEVRLGKTFRWAGRFGEELKDPKTISTCLNVFEFFKPEIRGEHRESEVVFLGNIDPELQWYVLGQMNSPRIVACDTHGYWISKKRAALKKLMGRLHILFLNEEEARKFAGIPNLLKAGREISRWGPRAVIIKKGEHGALVFSDGRYFSLPAFPVEDPKDPTGAGDSFAGGFLGYLCGRENWDSPPCLRNAVAYGSVMASFNVEDFSTRKLENLALPDIHRRFSEYAQSLTLMGSGLQISHKH